MTYHEFAAELGWLEATLGKSIVEGPVTQKTGERIIARMRAFFELLDDLPAEAFRAGCRRVAVEHKWNTFPTIADLRSASVDAARGLVTDLSAAEAWKLAWKAAARIDLDIPGSAERHLKGLPALVVEAVHAYGLPVLLTERPAFAMGRFAEIFAALQARERRLALLPPRVTAEIARIGQERAGTLPAPAQEAVKRIGVTP